MAVYAGVFRVYCVDVPAGYPEDDRDNLPIGPGSELIAEFSTLGEAMQCQAGANKRISENYWAVVTKNVTKTPT